jgi:hypothetical protein
VLGKLILIDLKRLLRLPLVIVFQSIIMSPSLTSSCQQPDARKASSSVNTKKKTHNDEDNDNDDYTTIEGIRFVDYVDESQLHHVMNLVGRDLSEPYSGKNVVSYYSLGVSIHTYAHVTPSNLPTSRK